MWTRDRQHPVKRRRPIARGELPPAPRCALAALLGLAALAIVGGLGPALGRLPARASSRCRRRYTLRLKHVVLVDVLAIAGAVRDPGGRRRDRRGREDLALAAASARRSWRSSSRSASGAPSSCSSAPSARPAAPVLEGYSLALVDQLLAAVAGATIVAYALYTVTARDSWALIATVPFVVFGLARYL